MDRKDQTNGKEIEIERIEGEITKIEVTRPFIVGPMSVYMNGKYLGEANELRTKQTIYQNKRKLLGN